jgi:hypothetical protein
VRPGDHMHGESVLGPTCPHRVPFPNSELRPTDPGWSGDQSRCRRRSALVVTAPEERPLLISTQRLNSVPPAAAGGFGPVFRRVPSLPSRSNQKRAPGTSAKIVNRKPSSSRPRRAPVLPSLVSPRFSHHEHSYAEPLTGLRRADLHQHPPADNHAA